MHKMLHSTAIIHTLFTIDYYIILLLTVGTSYSRGACKFTGNSTCTWSICICPKLASKEISALNHVNPFLFLAHYMIHYAATIVPTTPVLHLCVLENNTRKPEPGEGRVRNSCFFYCQEEITFSCPWTEISYQNEEIASRGIPPYLYTGS